MTREEARQLWSRFVTEQGLSADEEKTLVRALGEDPELRSELLRDFQLDGSMRAMGWSAAEEEPFVREFADCLEAQGDEDGFVERVERTVKGRTAKHPGRALAAARRFGKPGESGIRLFLVAAGLLVALLVFALLATSGPGRPSEVRHEAARPVENTPSAPEKRTVKQPRPNVKPPEPKRIVKREKKEEPERTIPPLPVRKPIDTPPAPRMPRRLPVSGNPETKPAKAAPPAPPASRPTRVVMATLERVGGEVIILSAGKRRPATVGTKIIAGEGLECSGPVGLAEIAFQDGTRLHAGPGTLVRSILEDGKTRGKRVIVERGTVTADVEEQPPDRPMVFRTPHSDATVLGTSLRVIVGTRDTRLEVTEGRVRLRRLSDGNSVLVPAGHFAVAAPGLLLSRKPLLGRNLILDAAFEKGARAWQQGRNSKLLSVARGEGRQGSAGLRVDLTAGALCDLLQTVRVKAGDAYRVSAWLKAEKVAGQAGNPRQAVLQVLWLDSRGSSLGVEELNPGASTHDWKHLEDTLTVPAGAAAARIRLFAEDGTGLAWFDDVSFRKVNR